LWPSKIFLAVDVGVNTAAGDIIGAGVVRVEAGVLEVGLAVFDDPGAVLIGEQPVVRDDVAVHVIGIPSVVALG